MTPEDQFHLDRVFTLERRERERRARDRGNEIVAQARRVEDRQKLTTIDEEEAVARRLGRSRAAEALRRVDLDTFPLWPHTGGQVIPEAWEAPVQQQKPGLLARLFGRAA